MDYKEKVIALLNSQELSKEQKEKLENIFPELKESEDDRIRKSIIAIINNYVDNSNTFKPKMIAWLEKQGKSDKSLYIRFGDIPINGKSKIYNGEIETGIEEGISVYPAFEDKEGNVILGLNLPITKTSLHTQQYLLEYDSRPCYLVTGDYVGKGTDGEPLLKNVRIIKEIKPYRIKQDKENNTYVINNTPNCGISVYNDEELKESEGEMIRKGIIALIEFGLDDKSAIAPGYNITKEEAIAWLERQRDYDRLIEEMKKRKELLSKEKKKATSANDKLSLGGRIAMLQELLAFNICNTTDKVEPKFNVGDWIVDDETPNDVFCVIEVLGEIYKVIDIDGDDYRIPHYKVNKQFHLWTIEDAKEGDVLVNGSNIFIFHFLNDTRLMGYCHVNTDNGRFYDDTGRNECFCLIDAEVSPATKEQHDLLFQKMKDAEYEWDNEKKELSKIVDKSSWSEEDERNLKGIIDEIEANKNSAPDYDLATYDRFLYWLKSLKQRIGG